MKISEAIKIELVGGMRRHIISPFVRDLLSVMESKHDIPSMTAVEYRAHVMIGRSVFISERSIRQHGEAKCIQEVRDQIARQITDMLYEDLKKPLRELRYAVMEGDAGKARDLLDDIDKLIR